MILFLKKVNTGIISHKAEKETRPEDQEELFRAIGETILKHFEKADSKTNFDSDFLLKDRLKIKLAHLGSGGAQVYLDFDTESDGTKRLLSLLTSIFSSLDHGTVYIVDELNASLHARACDALIELFNSKETNPHGAQLIATTHDTNLLKSPFLRRDQIWFVEKDQEGASGVYPLTDIKTRKGDDLERAYLQGRYGAIPVFLSIKDIVEAL